MIKRVFVQKENPLMTRKTVLFAFLALLALLIAAFPAAAQVYGSAPVFNTAAAAVTSDQNLVTIALPFTDTFGDTHSAVIEWGDGTVQPGLIQSGVVRGAHTYGVTGTYTIRVVLTDNTGLTAVWHTVFSTATATYAVDPTLPGAALCHEYNGLTTANIRAGVPDAIRQQVYCRPLSVNGQFTGWTGMLPAGSGHIGVQEVLNQGVLQAVDVFSSTGLAAPNGVSVCLRGTGAMLLLVGIPRTPVWLGSFTLSSVPGFTCAPISQFGTLVLVTSTAAELAAQQQQQNNNITTASGRVLPPLPEYAPGDWLQQTGQCLPVTRGMVYLRAEPNEGSTSLAILPHRNPVQIDGMIGVWYAVAVNGLEGFIRADLLSFECGYYAAVG